MWRAKFLFCLFLLIFSLIVAKLFWWQVISSDKLTALADSQYRQTLVLPAKRGEIFSNDGFPLVTNQQVYLLFAETKKINDPAFNLKLAKILELPEASISAKILPGLFWVALAHKIPEQQMAEIKKLNLAGVGISPEPQRFYPEASTAAHLLGFLGSDENGKDKGYFGLEGYYDRELAGREGVLKQEKDVWGRPILLGKQTEEKAVDGRSLNLYLDRNVQYLVENKLKSAMEKYGARMGSVIVMDPGTGGILAMATLPNFDPGNFGQFSQDVFKNPVVSDSYEPGSTFKVVVMASAVDAGLVKASDTYDDSGPVKIGEYYIRTWNDKYLGKETATQIIEHSSNTGMVWVGKKLGKNRLVDYLIKFGFAQKTGIDLEGEANANLRPKDDWGEIDLATASFGQGIAITPIQMLQAVNVIASGGKLIKPEVVSSLIDSNGRKIKIEPQIIRQVIKPEAAEVVKEMMVAAVENGEAKWAKVKGYKIAGKTGTAQIPLAGHYDATKTNASFVGFAPADKPKFVMLVKLTEPTSSQWASETAAPLFFDIARELFNYYGIAPSQ